MYFEKIGTLCAYNNDESEAQFRRNGIIAMRKFLNDMPGGDSLDIYGGDENLEEDEDFDYEIISGTGSGIELFLPFTEAGFCDYEYYGIGIYPCVWKLNEGIGNRQIFPRIYNDKVASFPMEKSPKMKYRLRVKVKEYIMLEDLSKFCYNWMFMASDPAFPAVLDELRKLDYLDGFL